jgi:serine/threonine-protein kinase RsbW
MSGDEHGVVALSIPAKAEYIVLSRLALTGIARARPLDAEVLADLKLAITEACSNSIRHAYASRDGIVEIRYEVTEDKVAVEVTDTGGGFDAAVDVQGSDVELDEGGLGIAIIRAVVDDLAIESNGGGSRLRFVKYLV